MAIERDKSESRAHGQAKATEARRARNYDWMRGNTHRLHKTGAAKRECGHAWVYEDRDEFGFANARRCRMSKCRIVQVWHPTFRQWRKRNG